MARLALLGCLTIAGCTAQSRDPLDVVGGGSGDGGGLGSGGGGGGSGGGGGGGGGGGNPAIPVQLVGSWENQVILLFSDDVETVTTTWSFDRTGGCAKQVRSFSVVEGFPRTTLRLCRFSIANALIGITFTDTGGGVSFRFDFPGFSPDRLLLDDTEFQRVP